MSHPERDTEFEEFLQRRTLLPGDTTVEAREEPSPAMDAAVLNLARSDLQHPDDSSSPRAQPIPALRPTSDSTRRPRWALPVALAATIVLCLSVALNSGFNPTHTITDQARIASDQTRSAESAAAPTRAAGPDEPPTPRASVPASQNTPSPPTPAPASPPTSASAEAQAQAEGPAPSLLAQQRSAAAERSDKAALDTLAADKPVAAARAKTLAVPAAVQADPRAWLKRIAALRAAGKTTQADAEMKHFRAAFPEYPSATATQPGAQAPK